MLDFFGKSETVINKDEWVRILAGVRQECFISRGLQPSLSNDTLTIKAGAASFYGAPWETASTSFSPAKDGIYTLEMDGINTEPQLAFKEESDLSILEEILSPTIEKVYLPIALKSGTELYDLRRFYNGSVMYNTAGFITTQAEGTLTFRGDAAYTGTAGPQGYIIDPQLKGQVDLQREGIVSSKNAVEVKALVGGKRNTSLTNLYVNAQNLTSETNGALHRGTISGESRLTVKTGNKIFAEFSGESQLSIRGGWNIDLANVGLVPTKLAPSRISILINGKGHPAYIRKGALICKAPLTFGDEVALSIDGIII